jgi:hypothetical protein
MSLRHLTRIALWLLPTLLVICVGCQEDVSTTSLFTPDNGGTRELQIATGVDDSAAHRTLESIWKNTEGVLMQVFTQTIDCQVGGVFTVRPAGWPEGYDVVLTVDPGTMPLNHDPVVDFVMEIPVTGPVGNALSVPYEFHPDGIRFNQPVHVTVAWPEWAGAAPASGMDLWYLERESHDGSIHYRVTDRKNSEPVPATPLSAKALGAPLGHYSIDHFSRWGLADGDDDADDPDDGGKTIDLMQTALPTTAEGACCWTALATDHNVPIRLDF